MHTRLSNVFFVFLIACVVLLAGCASEEQQGDMEEESETMEESMQQATATLEPTEGNNVRGMVTFTQENQGVRIEAEVMGLSPGLHGFHIHENGDCSAPDASSAGGHFNPMDTPHGAPDTSATARHVGDLGNLEAGSDSTATYNRVDAVVTLTGPNTIVGKAVVVHGGEDDLESQPSGAAGPRVACGVIMMSDDTGDMDASAPMEN